MPGLAEPMLWRFDDLLLDPQAGTLSRVLPDGHATPVHIGSRAFQLLCLLVERRGELVSQHEIMKAIWPKTNVEQNNLSVQVATLRRALDANGGRASAVQNVPGRGYRFASQVSSHSGKAADTGRPTEEQSAEPVPTGRGQPIWPRTLVRPARDSFLLITACLLGLGALVAAMAWRGSHAPPPAESTAARLASSYSPGEEALRRRLSLVVLPFENLGGDGLNEATVDGITDDVITELAHLPILAVTARNSAFTYKGRAVDSKRIRQELGVHYALQGSVRAVGRVLRINAQLVSTETNEHLWAERFDAPPDTTDDVARKIMTTVRFRLIESEGGRSARERPSTPDFADVMLRAMSNQINLAPNPQNRAEVISLYEHAVTLDPNAVFALAGLAEALLDTAYAGWPREHPNTPAIVRRAEELIRRAETLRPDSSYFLYVKVYLLWLQRRCGELIPTARRAIELHPSALSLS